VYGDRLLALVHVADPKLQFEPVGRVGVVPSQREWRHKAREAWDKVQGREHDAKPFGCQEGFLPVNIPDGRHPGSDGLKEDPV
jgi:hypothetical protein